MAQPNPDINNKLEEMKMKVDSFKFNAEAPEFIPRSQVTQIPVTGYFYPCFHFADGSDWFYTEEQESSQYLHESTMILNEDLREKIVKQVEYQFSNPSLIASDSLSKFMNKDCEGYVPLSFIASSKKIKPLITDNRMLEAALRTSSKLVVSDDGKKVKRKTLFTERDKEELQARMVVVENLPEDCSHKNVEKIFAAVGSVKSVRICHPPECSTPRSSKHSQREVLVSNKLHALVEYETVEQAEKAVEKLNDERNWRKGLRVRLLLRRSPRSVIRGKKSDYDHFDSSDDDDFVVPSESLDSPSSQHSVDQHAENNCEDSPTGAKKSWNRGRVKPRGRGNSYNGRGLSVLAPTPIPEGSPGKSTPRGPKMPDGTRGFVMGRGKPPTTETTVGC